MTDRLSGQTAQNWPRGAILGLTSNDTLVFGLADNPAGGGIHRSTPTMWTDTVLTGGYPSTLSYGSVEDMEANNSFVLLSHGGANFTKVASGGGGATRQQGAPGASKTSDIETVVPLGSSLPVAVAECWSSRRLQTFSRYSSLMLAEWAVHRRSPQMRMMSGSPSPMMRPENCLIVDMDAASGTKSDRVGQLRFQPQKIRFASWHSWMATSSVGPMGERFISSRTDRG